jgi:hypothetical protein
MPPRNGPAFGFFHREWLFPSYPTHKFCYTASIQIVSKSPWQKVSIDLKRSVIEDPMDTQLANLAKRLGGWAAVAIPELTTTTAPPSGDEGRITVQGAAAVSPAEPFMSAFTALDATQCAIRKNLEAREKKVTESQKADKAVRKIADERLTDISKAQDLLSYKSDCYRSQWRV